MGCLQVGVQDLPARIERQVAHRCHVIQILVVAALLVQCHLDGAQLFVLHLQLDLVNLQFMQRSLHCLCIYKRATTTVCGRRALAIACASSRSLAT